MSPSLVNNLYTFFWTIYIYVILFSCLFIIPFLGLSYLEEVPSSLVDPYAGPRYTCKLCAHTSNLPDMVHHVIGRKHRQKYVVRVFEWTYPESIRLIFFRLSTSSLIKMGVFPFVFLQELKRPDLVTWDKQSIITQGGKIIRARAEIIERQDGRGTPLVGHRIKFKLLSNYMYF